MNLDLEQLAKTIEKIPFSTLFTQPYSVNLGGVRNMQDLQSNQFNDLIYAFYFDENKKIHGEVVKATTDPGTYYREKPMNVKGTAVLVHDIHYRGVYNLQDNGHKGYKAWRQVKEMSYIRDNDKNKELDFSLMLNPKNIIREIAYSNLHHAGKDSTQVDKWSAACQVVANLKKYGDLIKIGDKQIEMGLKSIFSYLLLSSTTYNKYKV